MKPARLWKILIASVLLLLLWAGVLTAFLPSALADGRRRLDRKRQDLAHLAEIRQMAERQAAARAVFDRLEAARPAPLETIMRAAVPGLRFEVSAMGQGVVMDDWRWERNALRLNDISGSDLIRLVNALESQRPPWKVVSVNLRGGPQTGQVDQVILTLETLTRASP